MRVVLTRDNRLGRDVTGDLGDKRWGAGVIRNDEQDGSLYRSGELPTSRLPGSHGRRSVRIYQPGVS